MHINESQIFETWAPIIESKTGITENNKLGWLSKYCHYHSLNESFNGGYAQIGQAPAGNIGGLMGNVATPQGTGIYGQATGSGDKFPSLLPLAIQVAARTIGFDIVNVIPMSGPTGVLTYLDYIYAGGGTDTTDKPTLIKVDMGASQTVFGVTGSATVGGTYYLGATATTTASTVLTVKFVGYSRIDGKPIFRVIAPKADQVWSGPTIAGAITNAAVLSTGVTAAGAIAGATVSNPTLVKALEDHIQGFAGAGVNNTGDFQGPYADQGTTDTSAMNRGVGESTQYNNMGLKAYTKFVEARTFQVAASVTTEQIQDLNKQYGIDVVSMVENALVNEVSQSINKDILHKAFSLGWLNNSQFYASNQVTLNTTLNPGTAVGTKAFLGPDAVSYTVPVNGFSNFAGAGNVANENQYTIQRRILSKVLAAGNIIAQRGRRGPANFIVANLQIASAIQDNAQFTAAPLTNAINQNNGSLFPVGTIAGMTLYVDPNMMYSDTRVLVGRKGADEEPGLKFMPYMMAESIQTIAEGTMSPKIAVKSRYALVEAGQLPQTQYYTLYIDTAGISII